MGPRCAHQGARSTPPKALLDLPVQLREERRKRRFMFKEGKRKKAGYGPTASLGARGRPRERQPKHGGNHGQRQAVAVHVQEKLAPTKVHPSSFLSWCGSKSSFILSAAGLGSNSTKLRRLAVWSFRQRQDRRDRRSHEIDPVTLAVHRSSHRDRNT